MLLDPPPKSRESAFFCPLVFVYFTTPVAQLKIVEEGGWVHTTWNGKDEDVSFPCKLEAIFRINDNERRRIYQQILRKESLE